MDKQNIVFRRIKDDDIYGCSCLFANVFSSAPWNEE